MAGVAFLRGDRSARLNDCQDIWVNFNVQVMSLCELLMALVNLRAHKVG